VSLCTLFRSLQTEMSRHCMNNGFIFADRERSPSLNARR
jgi:hypothetical protein